MKTRYKNSYIEETNNLITVHYPTQYRDSIGMVFYEYKTKIVATVKAAKLFITKYEKEMVSIV